MPESPKLGIKMTTVDKGRLGRELVSFCIQQACLCVYVCVRALSLDTTRNAFSVCAPTIMIMVSQQIKYVLDSGFIL